MDLSTKSSQTPLVLNVKRLQQRWEYGMDTEWSYDKIIVITINPSIVHTWRAMGFLE